MLLAICADASAILRIRVMPPRPRPCCWVRALRPIPLVQLAWTNAAKQASSATAPHERSASPTGLATGTESRRGSGRTGRLALRVLVLRLAAGAEAETRRLRAPLGLGLLAEGAGGVLCWGRRKQNKRSQCMPKDARSAEREGA